MSALSPREAERSGAPRGAPIFDAVFHGHAPSGQAPRSGRFSRTLLPWVIALMAHLVLVLVARQTEPSLESWSARVAALIHQDLADQAPIAVESLKMPPPPPPPAPEPAPTPVAPPPPPPPEVRPPAPAKVKRSVRKRARPKRAPRSKSKPPARPAPAQAAKIIAVAADPEAPLDMTGEVFVTGEASQYAGGVTTAQGTSARYVEEAALEPPASPEPPAPSRARAVGLKAGAWRCAWPQRAMTREIYEQSVTVRVTVRADGSVERASVLRDPGDGFGEAAVACALKTRFTPALNRAGEPIKAKSPPIKVRFTR